ncbi:MAG: hypothetical protein ACRYG8_06070 [Janthinobacterium lividum]
MSDELAHPIEEVIGSMTTDAGTHMLMEVNQVLGGDPGILAFRYETFSHLISAAARAQVECDQKRGIPAETVQAFDVTRWTLGKAGSDKSVILTLTLQGGGKLSFLLQSPMPEQMLETLQVMFGQVVPQKPDKPLN